MDSEESEEVERAMTHEEALADFRELAARAKAGDLDAVPRLRKYLFRHRFLWERAGNLSLQAQAEWINLIAGNDKHLREVVVLKSNSLKTEIGGPAPSPLESLLVERIVTSWLQICYAEARVAHEDETSTKWAEFDLKRCKTMHDLHLRSIAALATVRKLLPKADTPVVADALPEPVDPVDTASAQADQEQLAEQEQESVATADWYSAENRIAAMLGAGERN